MDALELSQITRQWKNMTCKIVMCLNMEYTQYTFKKWWPLQLYNSIRGKNSSKPSKQLGSDHGIAMNRQFSQIFSRFFLQKRGPPAGWDCRHGPEYCHRRGDSEGARSFRVPRNAVDLGRKRPRNGNETIPICSMYGIFTNICPYMEHMGYRWSTSRLSTRSSRSSWPRMLGGTPMGRLWWKLPYESGYIMVYYSLFGFIGVYWGLLWLILIFLYFLLDGGFHSHAGTPLSLVGKKNGKSMKIHQWMRTGVPPF